MVTWNAAAAASNRSWAEVFTATTGRPVRLAVEPDVVNRFKWTASGLFHLLPGFTNETSQMLGAAGRFAQRDSGPFPVRIVWSYSRSNSGFFTTASSGIKTPRDINPGTRIVDLSGFLPSTKIFDALLAWAGLERRDVTWVPVASSQEGADAVSHGRADIGFAIPTSATATRAEAGPGQIDWVELNPEREPEGAARFREIFPLIDFGIIPEVAVPSAVGKWGTEGINYLVTRQETDPELVYHLAKWLDENHHGYADKHPDNRFRTREVLMQGLKHTFIPCHRGLITYLKEKGQWTAAHTARQKQNSRLVGTYHRAYQRTLEKADAAGIFVNPENESWTKLWARRRRKLTPLKLHADLPDD